MKYLLLIVLLISGCSGGDPNPYSKARKLMEIKLARECVRNAAVLANSAGEAADVVKACQDQAYFDAMILSRDE